jgi:hypothetical protein
MDSNASSKKEDDDDSGSHGASPRTSLSSNASNVLVQSPSAMNSGSDNFLPPVHSINEIRDMHQLTRQALERRLSTLSTASSFGEVGDGILNWNPREAGVNGEHFPVSVHFVLMCSYFQCAS